MKYALVDLSRAMHQDDLTHYCRAQQRQLREDYASVNGGDGQADEVFCASEIPLFHLDPATVTDATMSAWRELLGVDFLALIHPQAPAGQQDALGFHDLGVLHLFLDLAAQTQTSWTSILSHETLEARADPWLHRCIELDDGTIIDLEICDRVEAEGYAIDNVELSNFNCPRAFEPPPNWATLTRTNKPGLFDFLGTSTYPNETRPGGYSQVYDPAHGWRQIDAGAGMGAYRKELAARGLTRAAKRRGRARWAKMLSMAGRATKTDEIA